MRAPMARAVIGGLITSTLLTLVMVPVVYTFFDDWATRMRSWWHRGAPKETMAYDEEPVPEARAGRSGVEFGVLSSEF